MNREELLRLYDREYAEAYDDKFLHSELAQADTRYELELLRRWIRPETRWLDVACGTGYYLAHFPDTMRAGLDLSPSMLALARRRNEGVTFREGSYLEPHPEWRGQWDLVSCMWYAYGLVSSMADLEALIANLAAWTAPHGRCFIPFADPCLISGVQLPSAVESPWPGEVTITGLLWSYSEEGGGKVHSHQIAPTLDHMCALLRRHFPVVVTKSYENPVQPGRRCLIASNDELEE
jgi:SAM-dependent methyltransferase